MDNIMKLILMFVGVNVGCVLGQNCSSQQKPAVALCTNSSVHNVTTTYLDTGTAPSFKNSRCRCEVFPFNKASTIYFSTYNIDWRNQTLSVKDITLKNNINYGQVTLTNKENISLISNGYGGACFSIEVESSNYELHPIDIICFPKETDEVEEIKTTKTTEPTTTTTTAATTTNEITTISEETDEGEEIKTTKTTEPTTTATAAATTNGKTEITTISETDEGEKRQTATKPATKKNDKTDETETTTTTTTTNGGETEETKNSGAVAGAVAGLAAVLAVICIMIHRKRNIRSVRARIGKRDQSSISEGAENTYNHDCMRHSPISDSCSSTWKRKQTRDEYEYTLCGDQSTSQGQAVKENAQENSNDNKKRQAQNVTQIQNSPENIYDRTDSSTAPVVEANEYHRLDRIKTTTNREDITYDNTDNTVGSTTRSEPNNDYDTTILKKQSSSNIV